MLVPGLRGAVDSAVSGLGGGGGGGGGSRVSASFLGKISLPRGCLWPPLSDSMTCFYSL